MHLVFKSRADADLLIMQPVAGQLLRIVGHEPTERGILEAAQLPAAIAALEAAVAADNAAAKRTGTVDLDDMDDHHPEQRVGLAQRAWPLIQMMKRSVAEKADIVWGV
jgi:hypothetical protein